MKTKNKAHHIANYRFSAGEKIFIDANVLLFLYPPTGKPKSRGAAVYSNALSKLLKAKAQSVVDALVLSEYFNRYLRLEYEALKEDYPRFKDFRSSILGRKISENAVADIKEIVRHAAPHDTCLARDDLFSVLKEMPNGAIDFNDGLIIKNCLKHGWKLLTDDGDCTIGGIELLTANPKLIAACP